jgi:hypothetical protein
MSSIASPARTTVAAPPALRLTRRGRRAVRVLSWAVTTGVVALVAVLLWVSAASWVAPGASAGDGGEGVVSAAGAATDPADVAAVEVVVGAGDTLWALARDHAPDRDPRSVVHDIAELNDLRSSTVAVGDRLLVPTR